MNNYRTIQQKDMHKLFPAWEHNIPTLGTKCSQPGNKTALRLALSLLLMFVLGFNTAWGQDYSGVYYIGNYNNNGYNVETPANNYYLVPAANPQQTHQIDAYYSANYGSADGDSNQPFLTTYKTNKDANSVWIIEASEENGFYYIKHQSTGRYVIYDPVFTGGDSRRKSMHLTTSALDDKAKFAITVSKPGYAIRPKSVSSGHRFFNVAGGNIDFYYSNGPTSGTATYYNGLVGLFSDAADRNGIWLLEIPKPTISQDPTTLKISMSCDLTGVAIRYTTDGKEPTKDSPLYEEDFLPEIGTGVFKAKAFNSSGDVASATTTFELTKNAAPSISINWGAKQTNISTTVEGGTIFYTTNGSNPTVSSSEYSSPIPFSEPTTFKAIVGKVGYAPSTVTTKNVIKVVTPTIYDNGNVAIAITTATVGASIYYTTDGSTPTRSSSLYSAPLTNMEGKTIKAFAIKSNNYDSDVATFGPVSFSCAQPIIRRTGADKFTITCSKPQSGVTIYYTTNGSTPSTSDSHVASGEAVTFNPSQLPFTVKAIAVADGLLNSSEASLTISNDGMSGSGTPADPYQIALNSDYSIFATKVNTGGEASACYIITSDINASGAAEITTPFTGTFDGNGYTISNLGHALFNTVSGGTVKNVILDAVGISGGTNVGAIANEVIGTSANKASIYNCGVLSGSVSGSGYVGSIVGKLGDDSNNNNSYARVINCYSYATIGGGSSVGGIVGYNSFASAANNLRTMVMNCMYYGKITGGNNKAPIYNGQNITNVGTNGLANYNYYFSGCTFTGGIDTYNCALAADERYLTRFEFYRRMLNSNGELAAWYATGSTDNRSEMYKWILQPSSYGTEHPFPVLAPQGIYPSVVNFDAENAEDIDDDNEHRNEGRKLTKMGGSGTHQGQLAVTIQMGSGGNQFSAPSGAGIKSGETFPIYLNITDKDYKHFNYNYGKVQLPYYNDYCTGNYTGNRVVTGWKIVSVSGGTTSYSTGDDVEFKTDGSIKSTPYNFADRKCTDKDLYSESGRIFSQGAYWDVPDGVTSITIEPYWGKAAYLCDQYWNVVYSKDHKTAYNVTTPGVHYTNGSDYFIEGTWQKVYNSLDNAVSALSSNASHSVYDYAVVLVGNYHLVKQGNPINNGGKPFTVMSADFDYDNEPDYSFILQFSSRQNTAPIRFDFINIPGLGMAQKSYEATSMPNVGIFKPGGWFEITNTATILLGQFEYDRGNKELAPLILHGGIIEQIVSNNDGSSPLSKTQYIHMGSNVWLANFSPGIHQDRTTATKHVPVSVTGGEYQEFHLTGMYRADASIYDDNAECYIHGGKFGEITGTGLEGIGNPTNHTKGNITWLIDQADITNFFGGGINAAKPSQGNIYTEITNSNVTLFCGGPKFGDMQTGRTVTTKAKDCTFGTFFGAGYGGNSYNRFSPTNKTDAINYEWNTWINTNYTCAYSSDADKNGISTNFDYEFIPMSGGMTTNVARLFINYLSFSLATTGNVSSTLTDCKVTGNFYGGGSLGKVNGDVTSTLTNCTLEQNAFGAGFSATLPTVDVMDTGGFTTEPEYDPDGGVYSQGVFPGTKTYTWQHAASPSIDKTKQILYTTADLTSLGTVTGNVTLTIDGNTVADENGKVMSVAHSVYGGGEESGVAGNTSVTVTGGTIGTTGEGGAEYGNVYGGGKGKADDVTAGIVKGSTNVSISGSPTILHNVYGGGAYGSVGTFSYDASGFPTGWTTTDNKGKCSVSITGGTIGTTGDNNGMVFGSSRGLEGNPSNPNVDKMAWVYDTDVTIGTQNSETGPSIKGSVYGGGENGHNFNVANVTVHSGTIGILEGAEIIDDRGTPGDTSDDISYTGARFPNRGNVYGSGCGTDTYTGTDSKTYFDFNAGIVRGNTTVLIDGGHVVHNVYGGGAMGSVGTYTFADADYHTAHPEVPVGKPISCADGTGTCTVTVSGGKIGVTGARMAGYGKGGPDDFGHVFGAGRGEMHDPNLYPNVETCAYFNKTILNISGSAFLTGSAYGGSESGHVLGDTEVNISGGQIGCGKEATGPFGTDVWDDGYIPESADLDCASWPFEAPFAPYDPYANAAGSLDQYSNGRSTEGGRLEASDGHTYYGNVFGGGSGSVPYFDTTAGISKYLSTAGSVEGKTAVTISGGHILTNVYGGCEATNVKGSATITMTGGTVGVPRTVAQIIAHPLTGYIFGAGKGDQRIFFNKETNVDRTFVNIEGGKVYGSIFGGGEDGHVFQNTTVNIGTTEGEGPTIGTLGTSYVDGNVFGGGRGFGGEALTAGNIGGSVELNVKSGKILGSVYGGGRLASVGYGLYLVDEEIEEGGETIKPYGILRPNDKYDGSYPDPSTDPASTYYNKGRGYITINISGGTIGNDLEYIYNPTADQKAAIPNTTFDYQNHLQYTKGGNVFTGGMGRLYALDGTTLLTLWPKLGKCKGTTLNMTGGIVKSSIYGGGEIGAVAENATVNINGGTVGTKVVDKNDATKYYYFGSVFGGGKGSVDNITYPGDTPDEDKIPISEAGTTGGNVEVHLNKDVASDDDAKGAIVRQVFGCNDMNGSPKGTVTVHVYATQNADKDKISVKPDKETETFDVEAVYGGGNLAAYEPTNLETGEAKVIIDGCGLTSIRQVYGGGNAASTPATDVEVNGTYEILELFGGGNGYDKLPNGSDNPGANVGYKDYHLVEDQFPTKEDRVSGDDFAPYRYGSGEATVNIKGGTIHRVFGGSNTKGNVRKTALTMLEELQNNGEPVCQFQVDEAYGGGKSAPMDAEAKLHMACIPGLQEAYGGAEAADIHDNVTLTITNGTFNRVFGGNNVSGTISGKITVNVEETGCRPVVIGELYGGGNLAAYSIYGYDDDGTPKESGDNPFDDPEVNVRSFTSIGAVYGGGYGTGAKMIASPTVNINESVGSPDTYPTTGDYDENGFKGKTITLDKGKPTEHTVTLPAHEKGKMGAIGDVFGGGNAAEVTGNTTVNIGTSEYDEMVSIATGDDVTGYYIRKNDGSYTEATGTAVEGTTYYKKVLGVDIRGNVYGGGNNAEVTGNTNVNIGKKSE